MFFQLQYLIELITQLINTLQHLETSSNYPPGIYPIWHFNLHLALAPIQISHVILRTTFAKNIILFYLPESNVYSSSFSVVNVAMLFKIYFSISTLECLPITHSLMCMNCKYIPFQYFTIQNSFQHCWKSRYNFYFLFHIYIHVFGGKRQEYKRSFPIW